MNKLGNKLILILLGIVIGLAIMVPFVPFTSCSNQSTLHNEVDDSRSAIPNVDWQSHSAVNWKRVVGL